MKEIAPIADRLWLRTDKSSGPESCWPFMGARNPLGYGVIGRSGRRAGTEKAHRVAYVAFFGAIPEGDIVRHKCDNPSCVNPAHLELGSHADNAMDRESRGRGNQARGESSGSSILTADKVLKIRKMCKDGASFSEAAKTFGVAKSTAQAIVQNHTWRHLIEEAA